MRRTAILCLLFLVASARAELPSPRLDRLTPLGGAAGSTVEVEVAGNDLEDAATLRFDHPGITATHLKDRKFRVTIAKDVPAGTYDARVVGRFGVSSPRLFTVSHGLAEVAEKSPNFDPETAQPIAVNTVVNGISDGNREDHFRFAAKKGQRVVVECQAQALDSTLDAVLTLTDAAGKLLASNGDYYGRDPLLEFAAPADGEYVVRLNDLSYRGGQPYRLVVTDRPHVEAVFPRAVQTGKPTEVTVLGRNLSPGPKSSAEQLESRTVTVTPPADVLANGGYRFLTHPTTHSVLPTAATCTLTGFQPEIQGVPAAPLLVTDGPVTPEQEPNTDPAKPQAITLPAVVSGRFDAERDADWFSFTPPADGPWVFQVYCERIAGRADPYLVVLDDKDNPVAELDDYGHRTGAFDGHLRDPWGTVTLQAKRTYRVLVQDRYRRGGPRYQYVLSVQKPTADFFPTVIHSQNPGPSGLNVRRGGTAALDVVVHHAGGVTGPVTITAGKLPKGLHLTPTSIPSDTRGVLVFAADADAEPFTGPITLTATGTHEGKTITREVRAVTRVTSDPQYAASRPMRELVACVLPESAPYSLRFDQERVEVEAGKKVELKLTCTRLWPDFKGAVTVIPLSLPGPVKCSQVSIAEGKTDATVTFEVQGGAKPGDYTVALMGQAQVPFAKDPKATTKPNTLVGMPTRAVTIVVRAAGKK